MNYDSVKIEMTEGVWDSIRIRFMKWSDKYMDFANLMVRDGVRNKYNELF